MTNNKKGHRYLQIAEELKLKIQQNVFQIGDQLPTEKEICNLYSVSRYTARSALKYLIDLQLIERRQGSGSVVKANETPLIHKSFMQDIDDLWQYGNTTRLKIFEQSLISDCEYLDNYESGYSIHLQGNRFISDESENPFCITNVYLWTNDKSLKESLLNDDEPSISLMSYLCPKNLQRVEQIVSARNMSAEEAAILGIDKLEAVLCAERKYYDNSNRHIATAINVHSADQYEYATVLHRRHE